MRKRTIVATVAALGMATVLFAGNSMMNKPMMGGMHDCGEGMSYGMHKKHGKNRGESTRAYFKKIAEEIGLSDAQKQEIKTIVMAQKEEMKVKYKKLQSVRKSKKLQRGMPDIVAFMSVEKFDKEAFKKDLQAKQAKRAERMQKRQANSIDQRADTMQRIFDILTPEQRTKLINLSQKG